MVSILAHSETNRMPLCCINVWLNVLLSILLPFSDWFKSPCSLNLNINHFQHYIILWVFSFDFCCFFIAFCMTCCLNFARGKLPPADRQIDANNEVFTDYHKIEVNGFSRSNQSIALYIVQVILCCMYRLIVIWFWSMQNEKRALLWNKRCTNSIWINSIDGH